MPDFPENIEVTDSSINQQTGYSDEVSLLIDDTPYKFWETVDINFSLDNLADTFSLSGPFDSQNSIFRNIFRPFTYKEVALYVAGEKILTGTLLKPNPDDKPESNIVKVEGYSFPGVVQDVNVSPDNWPLAVNGLDLKQIAEKFAEPFGIGIKFEVPPGAKFTKSDKVRLEPDGKIGSFLIKLAKQRGIIISSNGEGQLVFHGVSAGAAEVSLIGGKWPYLGGNVDYNGQDMYSEITALGTNNKKGAGKKSTVQNPLLANAPQDRPLVFKASDISAGGLKEAATAKLGRMLADSVKVNTYCVGWHRDDGVIWNAAQKIVYQNDKLMLYKEDDYIIRSAKLTKGPNAAKTDLNLVFPEAYNGKIKKSFPWEE